VIFRGLRRDRGGKILLNMCISLLALNVIFLVGSIFGSAYEDFDRSQSTHERVWVAGHNQTQVSAAHVDFCTSLTVAVHYLVLSSLAWMLVEAIHMYQVRIRLYLQVNLKIKNYNKMFNFVFIVADYRFCQ